MKSGKCIFRGDFFTRGEKHIEWPEQDKSGQTFVIFSEKGTEESNNFCKSSLLAWAHVNGRSQQWGLVAKKAWDIWGELVKNLSYASHY